MANRHPNKEIQAALNYAVANGWSVEKSKRGHNWGRILCDHSGRDGCLKFVYSTPRDPVRHARDIRYCVDHCPHSES